MNKHMWWAWVFKNSIPVICFTALAIHFEIWWIALFSIMFMSSVSSKVNHDEEDKA